MLHNELESSGRSWWLYTQWGQGPNAPWTLNSSAYNRERDPLVPDPRRWLFAVNGVRIFARGANWVPSDHLFGRAVREHAKLRALLGLARAAGFTYLRVWGGGLVEDQSFFRLCDQFGLMVQQDLPGAGCSLTPPWQKADVDSWSEQVPVALSQLRNHPCVVRYSMGNELYLNASYSPVAAAYVAAARHDPQRMAREADPTCVGQRHGPYVWSFVGEQVTYDTFGLGCNLAVEPHPGCRFNFTGGGAADPFEWSEFGHPALADESTLRRLMPGEALTPIGVAPEWGWHSGSVDGWLAKESYEALFVRGARPAPALPHERTETGARTAWQPSSATEPPPASAAPSATGSAFGTLAGEVRASQWAQAEALRFALQSARRRKWHRSLMAIWTLNEPWPNTAYGNLVDYYGVPKMGYWWVADACAMISVSLAYRDVTALADGVTPLAMSIWIDSEWPTPVAACCALLELVYENGTLAAPPSVHAVPNGTVPPSRALRLHSELFTPPRAAAGGVLLARLSLLRRHDFTGGASSASSASSATNLLSQSTYAYGLTAPGANETPPLAPLLSAPRTSLSVTCALSAHADHLDVTAVAAPTAAALYATLSLRYAPPRNATPVPFVAFGRNAFVMLPGERVSTHATPLQYTLARLEARGALVCAEAWNAERVCIRLAQCTADSPRSAEGGGGDESSASGAGGPSSE